MEPHVHGVVLGGAFLVLGCATTVSLDPEPVTRPLSDEAFFRLVLSGTAERIQAAVDARANANARNDQALTSPMATAAHNRYPEVVTMLLDSGADATLVSIRGESAFDQASSNPYLLGTDPYERLCRAMRK